MGSTKPIGKLYSFNPKPEVIEEDELEEATGADSAGPICWVCLECGPRQ